MAASLTSLLLAVYYNCVRILAIASLEILTQLYTVYIPYFSVRKGARKNIYSVYHILTPLVMHTTMHKPLPRPPENFLTLVG